MCRDTQPAGNGDRQQFPRTQLETAWHQAWEACGRAAQCGDYATADHWYRRATQLGVRLAAAEDPTGERWQPPAGAFPVNELPAPG